MISILLFALTTCTRLTAGHGELGDFENPTNSEKANAFMLAFGAGMSTVIGAAVAFCLKPEDVEKQRSTFLAACLSFAAAVMLYVSFIEIWPESLHHYEEVEHDEQIAHLYTSLTFFFGIVIGFMCNKSVQFMEKWRNAGGGESVQKNEQNNVEMQSDVTKKSGVPVKDGDEDSQSSGVRLIDSEKDRKARLLRTGIVTAISIALHNFPEGVVVFLGALSEWKVGVATAFAIAIHNIPEGISIAVPYYYASKSPWKAFLVAFLSGLAEPFGALIGWAIIDDVWGNAAFGLMFGLTAGIMVYISFCELLPLARRNDPEDKVTTAMLFAGMIVMDISLLI